MTRWHGRQAWLTIGGLMMWMACAATAQTNGEWWFEGDPDSGLAVTGLGFGFEAPDIQFLRRCDGVVVRSAPVAFTTPGGFRWCWSKAGVTVTCLTLGTRPEKLVLEIRGGRVDAQAYLVSEPSAAIDRGRLDRLYDALCDVLPEWAEAMDDDAALKSLLREADAARVAGDWKTVKEVAGKELRALRTHLHGLTIFTNNAPKEEAALELILGEAEAAEAKGDWQTLRDAAGRAQKVRIGEYYDARALVLSVEAEFELTLKEAEAARTKGNWPAVKAAAAKALALRPGQARAMALAEEAETEITLQEALRTAEAAKVKADWRAAKAAAAKALALRPGQARAMALAKEAEIEMPLQDALRTAEAAKARGDWLAVKAVCSKALAQWPGEVRAQRLVTDADVGLILAEAMAAKTKGDWRAVKAAGGRALVLRPDEMRAQALIREAEGEIGYRDLQRTSEEAKGRNDWASREKAAVSALELRPGDAWAESVAAEARIEVALRRALRPAASSPRPGGTPAKAPYDEADVSVGGGVLMRLVHVPAGTFTMGSRNSSHADERPAHRVTISKPFWIGKTEVTQGEYGAGVEAHPSRFKGTRLPVECVAWTDAVAFCAKLTARERDAGRLPVGFEYRLPTEAEWEYACRAEPTVDNEFGAMAWYGPNSGGKTHEVGMKRANAWGLHDMLGNVSEWCLDACGRQRGYLGSVTTGTYRDGIVDPVSVGPLTQGQRVFRGGSWDEKDAAHCAETFRMAQYPNGRDANRGFRVVLASVLQAVVP